MSINPDNTNDLLRDIYKDLSVFNKQSIKATVNEVVEGRLYQSFLNKTITETFKAEVLGNLGELGQKQIDQLNPIDLQNIQAVFKKSLRGSDSHDSGISLQDPGPDAVIKPQQQLLITEALKTFSEAVLSEDGTSLGSWVSISFNEDPELKRDFILFLSESDIDPTSDIRELSASDRKKIQDFLIEKKALLVLTPVFQLRSSLGLSLESIKQEQEGLKEAIKRDLRGIQDVAHSYFQPNLVLIGSTEDEVKETLTTLFNHNLPSGKLFPICSQVKQDFLPEQPRTTNMEVSFNHTPSLFPKNRNQVNQLLDHIENFATTIGYQTLSPENQQKLLKVISFFCSQHAGNSYVGPLKRAITEWLINDFDFFSCRDSKIKLSIFPILNAQNEVTPLQFKILLTAEVVIERHLSSQSSNLTELQEIQQARETLGIGPCFKESLDASILIKMADDGSIEITPSELAL